MPNTFDPACATQYFVDWAIIPDRLKSSVRAIQDGILQPIPIEARRGDDEERPFLVDRGGIATIPISGSMMKGVSKFGGTSTVRTRRALRLASTDSAVKGIMLRIDSPGGTVPGTAELAADIREASMRRPLAAFIEDLGASAAYWAAAQAPRVTANRAAEVGSIGVYAVVYDESKRFEAAGVKVLVVSAGKFKGLGAPGTEVSEEELELVQERVDHANDMFVSDVAAGRRVQEKTVRDLWATGRVWSAEQAQTMGLIDGVETFEEAVVDLKRVIRNRTAADARRRRLALAELEE